MTDKTPRIQSTKAPAENIVPTLTEAQIARIAAHGRARRVQSGEMLVEAGTRTARFFVVTAGQIEVISRPDRQTRVPTRPLGKIGGDHVALPDPPHRTESGRGLKIAHRNRCA